MIRAFLKSGNRPNPDSQIGQFDEKHGMAEGFQIGDEFGISFNKDFEIGSTIVGIVEDGIVIELDDRAFEFLTNEGWTFEDGELTEGVAGPKSCWKGHRKVGTQPGTGKNKRQNQ